MKKKYKLSYSLIDATSHECMCKLTVHRQPSTLHYKIQTKIIIKRSMYMIKNLDQMYKLFNYFFLFRVKKKLFFLYISLIILNN